MYYVHVGKSKVCILLVVEIIISWFPLYPTGAGCVAVTLAVLSPVCIGHNPVESIRINHGEQSGTPVIFIQLLLEHTYDSVTFFGKRCVNVSF